MSSESRVIMYGLPSPLVSEFEERNDWRRHQRSASRSSNRSPPRSLVTAWKTLTRSMRRRERASVLPEGFVLMEARRRSRMLLANTSA
ncbi:hypothetical protein OF83DRAFT_1168798 [Amylostereum chailletii]|nr:hypothetical protein OF83DRAFT_1168798 [Amylostereum chailletii]